MCVHVCVVCVCACIWLLDLTAAPKSKIVQPSHWLQASFVSHSLLFFFENLSDLNQAVPNHLADSDGPVVYPANAFDSRLRGY